MPETALFSIAIVTGLALLSYSADRFVAGASDLARSLGISTMVIGLTVVAFGTSAPEMLVSAMAAWQGDSGLAIGNAVGSNIANIGLVLGVSALVAPLMTLLLATAIVIPLLGMTAMLGDELSTAYRAVLTQLAAGPPTLPASLADIPWLGERLQALLERLAGDPAVIRAWLAERGPQWVDEARQILSAIGRNAFKLGITLLALFFLYRDGDRIITETRLVLQRFLGTRVEGYWLAVTATTRGVVYGLVLTALAQGVLAGIGYWVAGVGTPVLLGALTALLALIPFGAPLIWGSTGLWLLVTGEIWAGTGLLLWGALVVSMVDNVVRPLAISSAARIPPGHLKVVAHPVVGGLRHVYCLVAKAA